MTEQARKVSARAGLLTGAETGGGDDGRIRITVMDYGLDRVDETVCTTVAECLALRDSTSITWINVEGLGDRALIEEFGERFGLHSLHLEDILDTSGRPKLEDNSDYLLVVLKMLYPWGEDTQIVSEHVSLIVGGNYLISFQEGRGDVFDAVRALIRKNKGRVRKEGADYLAYLLMDAIVDSYFTVLEEIGEFMEETEEEVLDSPDRYTIHDIHDLKTSMLHIRKAVVPLREVIWMFARGDSDLVGHSTEVHFRDLYDHIIQIIDILDTYRDIISSLLDTYLSSLSNRMNEIMKVLTIFSTIFIPLTFLAGVYGMNFRYFPELEWKWAYPGFWTVCIAVGLGMLVMFKKKKWL